MDIMHFPMTVKKLLSWATLSLLKQVNEWANDGARGERLRIGITACASFHLDFLGMQPLLMMNTRPVKSAPDTASSVWLSSLRMVTNSVVAS